LDKAYDINDGNSNLLYYRGLVYLYLGKFDEALQDIIKAISKSEENVAKYFFFRALTHKYILIIFSSLGNRKQALNDLNICNNLDDKFSMVYLERAKVHFSN
jgi:tetratricopeptide (TPR) repeat protein